MLQNNINDVNECNKTKYDELCIKIGWKINENYKSYKTIN